MWRRDGRVVDCDCLENSCTARYRGFESLSLRQTCDGAVAGYEPGCCIFSLSLIYCLTRAIRGGPWPGDDEGVRAIQVSCVGISVPASGILAQESFLDGGE